MHAEVRRFAATVLLLPLTGCFVSTKKGSNGDDNVDIRTPLGGMSVKTDNAAVTAKLGLPVYPGAVPEKKEKDDSSSADVNMNFGFFHLRVLAEGYSTTDSPDKVRAFYKKALGKYGDVIECQEKHPIGGSPVRTAQGLTCDDDDHINVGETNHKIQTTHGEIELKAGSKSHQHIVGFEEKSGGTKFALVALELPSGDEDDKQPN